MTDVLLHIAPAVDWERARESGVYAAPSLADEGFIHLSRPEQVQIPANAFYSETAGLLLLWIDPARLRAELREEHGFPHLYGPLDVDAVVAETPLAPWRAGEFELPPRPA